MLNSEKVKLLFLLLFWCPMAMAQELYLDGAWRYTSTDNASFSQPDAVDSQWKEKNGNNLLFTEKELAPESKFLWLRKKVVIPASLQKALSKTGALSLFLGRIYQSDEVFFNGKLIGKTNTATTKRAYIIDPQQVRWDKENWIAIRMSYWGGKCGVEAAPPYLGPAVAANIFHLSSTAQGTDPKQPVKDKPVVYTFSVTNNSPKVTEGEVSADFYDFSNQKLRTDHQKITLSPGNNRVGFSFRSPGAFLKIRYTLTVPELAYTASRNDEYGYEEIVYQPVGMPIADQVKDLFTPAELQQQVIEGWLGTRLAANEEKRLYQVDEEALLAGFINQPGDHPWIGEHVGKFLDAASNTYRSSGNAALKVQIDRTAQQLIAAQAANGYFGTYTPENHWTSWDVWCHKYNLIGLLNYYSLSGFEPALNASRKAGDLLCQTFGNGPGQLDIIRSGTHVGMAATSVLEPMVDLYKYTGERKYLDFCQYIVQSMEQSNGPKLMSTLEATGGRVDKTANRKAYEMMSNFLGLLKMYKLSGEERFFRPVVLAWKDIVTHRLYITGTTSSFEHFHGDGHLPAGENDNVGEGCVTTTWLQLNYQLLCITGEMKYVNELERSVYNQLTAAENPQSGCVSYFTPLSGVKPFSCAITCCMSSVPRGISMIPLFTNGKLRQSPSFLFYQPGTYTTMANHAPISFQTVTRFPLDGQVAITVTTDRPVQLPLSFRKPYWAEDFTIQVNGKKQKLSNHEVITVDRVWKKGDQISIRFAMPVIVLPGGQSYPDCIALQKGPQVLSFDKSLNAIDPAALSIDPDRVQLQLNPSVLPDKWIGTAAFQLKAAGQADQNVILVPYADASQTGGSITTWLKKKTR